MGNCLGGPKVTIEEGNYVHNGNNNGTTIIVYGDVIQQTPRRPRKQISRAERWYT
jgi:hypothetical protein